MPDTADTPDPGRPAPAHPDTLASVDVTAPEVIAAPHAVYGPLLAEAPVAWSRQLNGWLITRHEDVARLLRHPGMSVEKLAPFVARSTAADRANVELLGEVLGDWMVFKDPPDHTALRRALKDAFMPAEIAALQPRVRAIVDELLADLPRGEPVDMVARFAFPLPAMVIGDLFGLPRAELDDLKRWSEDLSRFVLAAVDDDSDAIYRKAGDATRNMQARFHDLVAARRRETGDGTAGAKAAGADQDFTTRLIANGTGLSDAEIVHTLVLLLWAGHETTTNLIATSLYHLAAQPARLAALKADPGAVPAAVEEFLRFDGPAQMLVRLAREDVTVGEATIRAGERVLLMLNTANRDAAMFDSPETLDLTRAENRHLGFGRGIHMCLGAPLARLEGAEALHGLIAQVDRLSPAEPVAWRQNLIIRGPKHLQLVLD